MLVIFATVCTACTVAKQHAADPPKATQTDLPIVTQTSVPTVPAHLAAPGNYGPPEIRYAYQIDPLLQHGITGKNQTVVITDSYGDPQLQSDFNAYCAYYGLPSQTLEIVAPLGPTPPPTADQFNQKEHTGWAVETALDVEMVHAVAPDAHIVVLTSPVDSTEGTGGLPQFRQLIQYAMTHYPGAISSNSWAFSEASLRDDAGQTEIRQWGPLLQQATLNHGMTLFFASGDLGVTDYTDPFYTQLSPTRTTEFPADEPWVTSVGATSLTFTAGHTTEGAWTNSGKGASGGGMSSFVAEPAFQHLLPTATQTQLHAQRGIPDVAILGDPATGVKIFVHGQWLDHVGGTSVGTPLWAGILALADQQAGKPLGFINPLLYELGTSPTAANAFHDTMTGNNSMQLRGISVVGYPATPGWDPVTGFGSPNAAVLVPELISLAHP